MELGERVMSQEFKMDTARQGFGGKDLEGSWEANCLLTFPIEEWNSLMFF